jgi:hypothetical protein
MIEDVRQLVQEKVPRIYSKDLIEAIFLHPYCKIRFLEDAGVAKRPTASDYLKILSTLGGLQPHKVGRDVYYVNGRLLSSLTGE